MATNVRQLIDGMIFWEFPWGEPTEAVVEYKGQMYEVRASWGTREGWTNDYGAEPMPDEDVKTASENVQSDS